MKYKLLHLVPIVFMTTVNTTWLGMTPLASYRSATGKNGRLHWLCFMENAAKLSVGSL